MADRDQLADFLLDECFARNPQYVRDVAAGSQKAEPHTVKCAQQNLQDCLHAADKLIELKKTNPALFA